MPRNYMQENAFSFLRESGLAEEILNSENGFRIKYNRIPAHRGFPAQVNDQQYYRFVSDYLRAVIALCDEASTHRMVEMTSKHLIMDQEAVAKFREGWEILKEML